MRSPGFVAPPAWVHRLGSNREEGEEEEDDDDERREREITGGRSGRLQVRLDVAGLTAAGQSGWRAEIWSEMKRERDRREGREREIGRREEREGERREIQGFFYFYFYYKIFF